jgi:pimeloyl-ACP methyl ester carboxylesterase
MNTISMKDVVTIFYKVEVTIFYKERGTGQPIVLSHGWPLSADDWDTQMMFLASRHRFSMDFRPRSLPTGRRLLANRLRSGPKKVHSSNAGDAGRR